MITVGTIAGLWRYPVKSMGGEALDVAVLTSRGMSGDRVYALVDRITGKVASAKHPRLWGQLLACRAAGVASFAEDSAASAPAVRITLPSGRDVLAGSASADDALSTLVGRAVALSAQPPAQPEIERYWPDIAGLALRDTVTASFIGAGSPAGTFFDYAPIHLVTTTSLTRLQALHPDSAVAVQRFRPSLVVVPDENAQGVVQDFVENDWVGRTLLIGEHVRLQVISPTPRCVVPTLPQQDLLQDVGILRTLVAHNKVPIPPLGGVLQASLGVYAAIERGGAIHTGDPVRIARRNG